MTPFIDRWPRVLRVLHWLSLPLLLAVVLIGWQFEDLEDEDPSKIALFGWHASVGLTLFLVMVLRLALRQASALPAPPATLSPLVRRAALAVQGLMYALLLTAGASGFLANTLYPAVEGTPFWGLVLPDLLGKSETFSGLLHTLHTLLPWPILVLVAVHAAGALWHRFAGRPEEDVLRRMW